MCFLDKVALELELSSSKSQPGGLSVVLVGHPQDAQPSLHMMSYQLQITEKPNSK